MDFTIQLNTIHKHKNGRPGGGRAGRGRGHSPTTIIIIISDNVIYTEWSHSPCTQLTSYSRMVRVVKQPNVLRCCSLLHHSVLWETLKTNKQSSSEGMPADRTFAFFPDVAIIAVQSVASWSCLVHSSFVHACTSSFDDEVYAHKSTTSDRHKVHVGILQFLEP